MINGINDELILAARLLLATLFLIFGWRKLRDFSGTVSQMVQLGVPTPVLAAAVATFMELPVAFAVAVGAFTRPSALLLVLYTLGTALIGHRYWTLTGADQVDSMDGFYKNLSIMGGFSLLYITGRGKIFDRCIVRCRRTLNVCHWASNATSRRMKPGSRRQKLASARRRRTRQRQRQPDSQKETGDDQPRRPTLVTIWAGEPHRVMLGEKRGNRT